MHKTHTHLHTHSDIHTHTHTHACTSHTHAQSHIHTHTQSHTCTHTHTHKHPFLVSTHQLHQELCLDAARCLVLSVTTLRQQGVHLIDENDRRLVTTCHRKQGSDHLLPFPYLCMQYQTDTQCSHLINNKRRHITHQLPSQQDGYGLDVISDVHHCLF